jgi:hypothetical protein
MAWLGQRLPINPFPGDAGYERKKPLCTKTRNLKAQFIAKRSKLTLVSHAGILGNKCADAIAKISAKK